MRNYSQIGGKQGLPGYRTPSSFKSKVLKVVRDIPKGKTLSYKEVAFKVGSSRSYRAVRNILNKNKDLNIPCHRVIRSDGKVGGYNRGEKIKYEILKKEKSNVMRAK